MVKVILITGISSGFGEQTAELLAKKGHSVYGTIRKECEVSDRVNIVKMDLTDNESIKKAVEKVIEKEGRIDVLINNAGMHTGGSIETSRIEDIKLQMDTNWSIFQAHCIYISENVIIMQYSNLHPLYQ